MPQTTIISCRYCERTREVPAYYAKRYSTCGSPECTRKRFADRAVAAAKANTGKKHTPDVNARKGRPGRPQSPEHVAKRTAARKEGGWFKIPDIGERISAARTGKPMPGVAGPKNGMWRGGVKMTGRYGSSREYWDWRTAVLDRAEWRCEECGATEHVIAHHIEGWREAPKRRTDTTNGKALCRRCHMITHGFTRDPTGRFNKSD